MTFRIRHGLREYRGAIATALALAVVVGLVATVVPRQAPMPLPSLNEPPGLLVLPKGDDVGRLAPVTVTFPVVPATREGDKLLRLEPAAKGTFAWLSTRTLLFQPDYPGLLRGGAYTVRVPGGTDTGIPQDITQKFTVTGRLVVQQVIPAKDDAEVPLNAQVIVQFSRSVAPLTTLGAQRTDPIVSFEPALKGKGEWLNTSIYRFIPESLEPSTTYRLRIAKGLTSAADGVLQEDFISSFTTVTPGVATVVPEDNFIFAAPTQKITVTFNQPMDPSAAGGIAVRDAAGNAVPGTVSWSADATAATLTPASSLPRATVFVVSIEKGLKGAKGGTTSALRTSSFRTVAPLAIQMVQPGDGSTNAPRFGVNVRFNNPMDRDSLEGKLRISGFSDADLEGKVFADPGQVGQDPASGRSQAIPGGIFANVALKPSTSYTVELLPGARDAYGQVSLGYKWSFTTGAIPPQVTLAIPGFSQSATYSSSAEPRLYFQTINLPSVSFTVWPLTADEARSRLHGLDLRPNFTPSQKALRTWTETVSSVKDDVVLSSTSLSGGGPLEKGYYFLRTSGQFASQFAFAVVDTDIVTKLSTNELLAWAIDHDSGKPVAGVPLSATGAGISPAKQPTDKDGLASFSVPLPRLGDTTDRSYYVSIDPGGAGRVGVGSTRWSPGISPFQFNIPSDYFAREWVGQIYTDRPIYRPGETVDFKGIVRRDDDARYTLPPSDPPLQLVIMNARGQQVRTEDVKANDFGTFAGTFELPSDAPLGDYSISVQLKPATSSGARFGVFGNSFRVAEFRAPEYQVSVGAGQPSYVDGSRIDVKTSASFFFGGALAGAPVQWSVTSLPYALRVPGYERYSFADFDAARTTAPRNPTRASGSTTTDASGVATFAVPATLAPNEGAQQFTISATVTDQNGQAVASSTTVTVHPADTYAGVHPAQYVATEGSPATIELVTADTNGSVVGGKRVSVKVYDRQWISTKEVVPGGGNRYTSVPKDTLLDTLSATTDAKGEAKVPYTPAKPGTIRIVAEVTDAAGRTSRSAQYLWVAGKAFASWQITNDDTIQLVADKDRYEVGDTAEVLVPAPFGDATALVTVERGKIISREVRTLPTNSERIRIPVTEMSIPDVFVSVVLYRGPTAADPTPRFKVGYVKLPVSTTSRSLSVSVTPDRKQTKPGETVHYDIKVTDRNGKGVRAELSVAVVDKAVLSLEEERGPDGLHAFWFERGLGVSTASSISISMDRANDVLSEAPKVGKGGSGGGLQGDATRKDFRNTAFWSAQVTTKDDGTASVDVKMPDNLTTWRLQARAVSGDTLVGEGTNELTSTQPLLVRPALPRFLRVGDAFELRALVRNATDKELKVDVGVKTQGLTLREDTRAVTVRPQESAMVSWPATVDGEGTVTVTFSASGGGLSDTVTQSLPALLDVTPEATATGGIVTSEPAQEALYLPPFARTDRGSLSLEVRSTLVGAMADELRSLEPVSYEGAERVASRLMATIGVRRAEKSARGSSSAYDGRIASDVAGLIGRQRPDGGWAWCDAPQCLSDPHITGLALLALGEARRDGIQIESSDRPLQIVSRATNYVMAYIGGSQPLPVPGKPGVTIPGPVPALGSNPLDPNEKAFLAAALAAAGAPERGGPIARALFEQDRARLVNWGRAYLILALKDSGATDDDPAVRALISDLNAAALPTANGDQWQDDVQGRFMTSAATTALGTLALARAQPDHALLPQTVRWLVMARAAQGWQTSVERAFAVLGLTTYAAATGELAGDYRYQVRLGAADVLSGLARPGQPASDQTTLPLSRLVPGSVGILEFAKDAGSTGRLYYKLDLRYTTPAQDIEAVNRGFAVSHEYTTLDDPDRPITTVKLGETVRVKMTILVPADRKYVVVEDLLPAGLEAVDTHLRTVDPALKAKLDADRSAAAQKNAGGGYAAPWLRWYYSPWQTAELRDDRAMLFADSVSKGIYEYIYYARATTPGDFFVAPAHAQESYFPDVFGRSDSARFRVTP